MRTAVFILAGFALWAACLGAARRFAGSRLSPVTAATAVFVVIWLVVASWNMWNGVSRAGDSLREELPIFSVDLLAAGPGRAPGAMEAELIRERVRAEPA